MPLKIMSQSVLQVAAGQVKTVSAIGFTIPLLLQPTTLEKLTLLGMVSQPDLDAAGQAFKIFAAATQSRTPKDCITYAQLMALELSMGEILEVVTAANAITAAYDNLASSLGIAESTNDPLNVGNVPASVIKRALETPPQLLKRKSKTLS